MPSQVIKVHLTWISSTMLKIDIFMLINEFVKLKM